MFIGQEPKKCRIKRQPSIFTSRKGLEDVYVDVQADHGGRESDGNRYAQGLWLAAESGDILRSTAAVHPEITVDWLRQSGFLDPIVSRT